MKIQIVSKCYCCDQFQQETMERLFLHSPTAQKLWEYFAGSAGIKLQGTHLRQMITQWW